MTLPYFPTTQPIPLTPEELEELNEYNHEQERLHRKISKHYKGLITHYFKNKKDIFTIKNISIYGVSNNHYSLSYDRIYKDRVMTGISFLFNNEDLEEYKKLRYKKLERILKINI